MAILLWRTKWEIWQHSRGKLDSHRATRGATAAPAPPQRRPTTWNVDLPTPHSQHDQPQK